MNWHLFYTDIWLQFPGQADFEHRKNLEKKEKKTVLMHWTSLMRKFTPTLLPEGSLGTQEKKDQPVARKEVKLLCDFSLGRHVTSVGLDNNTNKQNPSGRIDLRLVLFS